MMIQSEDGTGGILIPDGVLDDDAIERLKVAWMELHRGRVSKIDQEILPEVPPTDTSRDGRGDSVAKIVALIPARAGSKRAPGKNVRLLNGYPLLAYAIGAAQESGIFDDILVSSDSDETLEIAEQYGATCLVHRPKEVARDDSPDIEWVGHAIGEMSRHRQAYHAFAIIRPTSPFRSGDWIADAWYSFLRRQPAHSLRAMRRVSEHPGKMWVLPSESELADWPAQPYLAHSFDTRPPDHSMPTQRLEPLYVQTAALEIAWVGNLVRNRTISGTEVLPWLSEPDAPNAIDINDERDWEHAVRVAAEHPEWLPTVRAGVLVAT